MTELPKERRARPARLEQDLAPQRGGLPPASPSDQSLVEAQRDYLFDMLGQLAKIAAACGEIGVEMILKTIVLTRAAPLAPPLPADDLH